MYKKKHFSLHNKIKNLTSVKNKSKKKALYCSPKYSGTFTCFDKKTLVNIANHLNKNKFNSNYININNNKELLWNSIKNSFHNICNSEICWLKQPIVKQIKSIDINSIFRPEMPREWLDNDREWLSTIDIEKVINQYKDKYSDFEFIGPVPIDFDSKHPYGGCIVDELCNIDIKKMIKNNKTKLGIVFNLDPHDKPGSHWVSLFSDFIKGQIYYYDSYGTKPPLEVNNLMNKLESQIYNHPDTSNNIDKTHNKIRHQYMDSECGVYSMQFIINLLENKSFDYICNHPVHDNDMNKNRFVLYRPPDIN